MEMKRVKKSIEKLAKIVENLDQAKYILRLYVTGMTPKSTRAIDNVQKLCEKYMEGFYELKIMGVVFARFADEDRIIALARNSERNLRRRRCVAESEKDDRKLIGDMSDTEKFLAGIDLRPKAEDRRQ